MGAEQSANPCVSFGDVPVNSEIQRKVVAGSSSKELVGALHALAQQLASIEGTASTAIALLSKRLDGLERRLAAIEAGVKAQSVSHTVACNELGSKIEELGVALEGQGAARHQKQRALIAAALAVGENGVPVPAAPVEPAAPPPLAGRPPLTVDDALKPIDARTRRSRG